MRHSLAAFALLLVVLGVARAEDPPSWNPAKTYVLVASVIEWPDKALAAFKDARRDEALVEQFKADGVPAANVVFLKDKDATLAALRRELHALAGRAGEGSTFIFYFQGHGLTRKEKTFLACYDVNTKDLATAFDVDELFPILDKEWKGDRLLLLGDCCHAGALGTVVQRFEGKTAVRAACLTSSTASNRSTEHWTFTEALITALAGDGAVDRDRDGKITFGEVDLFAHDEMKFREDQLTRGKRTKNFEEAFAFRAVAADRPAPAKVQGERQVGEFLEACDRDGKWYVAQILAIKDDQFRVHYSGWDSKWDEWVGAAKLRPIARPKLKVGERYEVEWQKDQWFLATVTKAEEDWFYFVHYEGEEGDDDEWVTASKTRTPAAGTKPKPPEFAALAPRALVKGDAVAARWKRAWFLAEVTSIDGEMHAVRYADGENGSLTAADLVPVAKASEVEVGDRVLACWNGKPQMYPGVVASKTEKDFSVKWEDGSKATSVPIGQVARIKAAGK
ncbi:MAG: caspase family protein [Planctomycetes bacterium]|nr:caspase family protein [Planctomycetota bacterium]